MNIREKHDYVYRRLGEEETVAYIKEKKVSFLLIVLKGKFIPKTPYAAFIEEKVVVYSQNGKSKVKIDHKFCHIAFKFWLTLSQVQKEEYIKKFKKLKEI